MLMQGFVALMGVYTVCAFACCLWSWLKGPTVAPTSPPRMLASTPPLPSPPPTLRLSIHAFMMNFKLLIPYWQRCVSVKKCD